MADEWSTQKHGPPVSRRQREPVRALDRGLAILVELGTGAERSLTDIADSIGLPYSTTHRLLDTLARRGFVQQSGPQHRYAIGVQAFQIGAGYVRSGVTQAAHSAMVDLVERLNETVNLAVRDGQEGTHAVYVHQVEGRQNVRMFTRIGARVPLHCSGVGKALLAWEPRGAVESVAANGILERFTPNTRTSVPALAADLASTRERGFAIDLEEYELGVRCAAAPIRDAAGAVVAAVSVSAPLQRLDATRLHGVGNDLLSCATEISRRLGWAAGPKESAVAGPGRMP